uniref:PNPLA domain-containing protein n=1 Tax=Syphacia muris TaxID=451379 RepID=A0A0N5AVA5_9BILA
MENSDKVTDGSNIALSFSGCGFLGSYHFGALACLTRNGVSLKRRIKRCAGASAGTLVATLMVLAPDKAEDGLSRMYSLTEEMSKLRFGALTPGFHLAEKLAGIVEDFIPQDISAAQDKLYISLTRQRDSKNLLVSRFSSRKHLMDCLCASCYIPMYSMGFDYNAPRPMIDNETYIDGGYTNNLPIFMDIPTITVSPFSGSAMVSPDDDPPAIAFMDKRFHIGTQEFKVNLSNLLRGRQALFPPSVDILRDYYCQGYNDMLDFLSKNNIAGAT